jgi:poly(beta-D-mannuronate) lyase
MKTIDCRPIIFGFVFFILCFAEASGKESCPSVPPILRIETVPIYYDDKGSKQDAGQLILHNQTIRPLRTFLAELTRFVDRPESARAERFTCPLTLLKAWAESDALLMKPSNFSGVRERERFGIGINVVAIKLLANGQQLGAGVLQWIGSLNKAIMRDFDLRKRVDNLYAWSGVNAASYALINTSAIALDYQNTVWRHAIDQIDENGFVASELRRGPRALIYHEYYLSALLVFRTFRNALGYPISDIDTGKIQKLAARVGTSLCDDAALNAATGEIQQVRPRAAEFSPIIIFGADVIDKNWRRCGVTDPSLTDVSLGGDLDQTLQAIHKLRKHPEIH